jgi:hypothetical protein
MAQAESFDFFRYASEAQSDALKQSYRKLLSFLLLSFDERVSFESFLNQNGDYRSVFNFCS